MIVWTLLCGFQVCLLFPLLGLLVLELAAILPPETARVVDELVDTSAIEKGGIRSMSSPRCSAPLFGGVPFSSLYQRAV